MARKSTKLPRKKKKGSNKDSPEKAEELPVDQFMKLPEHILHQILSFVPATESIKMSGMSKIWRRVWYSLPSLYFSDTSLPKPRYFCKCVWKCLRLRKGDFINAAMTDAPILQFRLETTSSWRWSTIDGCLKLISKCKLKELDISIACRSRKYYRLPLSLLNMSSLINVRLNGVDINGIGSTGLVSLLSLSLENVKLDDEVLCDLLSGCSSLEKLCIYECYGLSEPKISGSKLKQLEICQSIDNEMFEFGHNLLNLESFVCNGIWVTSESSFSLGKTMKNLTFIESIFDDLWLENLILSLPGLESLTLTKCHTLKHVKISCPKLRHFTFDANGDYGHAKVNLDCPNLVYFCYRGYLQSQFSINPKNLLEANVRLFKQKDFGYEWFIDLKNFLSMLNCSDSLSLDVLSYQVLKFPLKLRMEFDGPLPRLKNMKLRSKLRCKDENELREVLNWLSPSLESLSITKR